MEPLTFGQRSILRLACVIVAGCSSVVSLWWLMNGGIWQAIGFCAGAWFLLWAPGQIERECARATRQNAPLVHQEGGGGPDGRKPIYPITNDPSRLKRPHVRD